ncbi:hypothetical protein C0995_012403 [Termitomyces sp. Mi166|nr:hypothetical protein C0995_012403 [Termitomyces sp. Mi166\
MQPSARKNDIHTFISPRRVYAPVSPLNTTGTPPLRAEPTPTPTPTPSIRTRRTLHPAMLDKFIPRWIQPRSSDNQSEDQEQGRSITITMTAATTADVDADTGLPFPVGTQKPRSNSSNSNSSSDSDRKSSYSKRKTKWRGHVSGASISYPIRSSPISLTGIDAPDPPLDLDPRPDPGPAPAPALGSGRSHYVHLYPYSHQHQHLHPHLYSSYNTMHPHPSPTRSGPSNVEWVVGQDELEYAYRAEAVGLPPAAVVRLGSHSQRIERSISAPFLSTPTPSSVPASSSSATSPKRTLRLNTTTSTSTGTRPTSTAGTAPGPTNAYTNVHGPTNPFTDAQSTHAYTRSFSLQTPGTGSVSTDVYNHAYNYPLAKQLSPILELDYFSPVSVSARASGSGSVGSGYGSSYGGGSGYGNGGGYGYGVGYRYGNGYGGENGESQGESIGYATSMRSVRSASGSASGSSTGAGLGGNAGGGKSSSPGGSIKSEINRLSTSNPFITRQLNRTISQTSSRTQGSATSSVAGRSPSSAAPAPQKPATSTGAGADTPSFSPPILAPPFPGPRPSRDGAGPPLRPRRSSYMGMPMPTIPGSLESAPADGDGYETSEVYGGEEDTQSLHAESFVTATGEAGVRVRGSRLEREEMEIQEEEEMEMEEVEIDVPEASYQASIDGESTYSLNPDRDHAQQQSVTSLHASPNPVPGSANNNTNTDTSNFNSNSHSTSSSFVPLRWDLDAPLGTSVVTFPFRPKTPSRWTWLADHTPAFWAFWLGFLFPVLWFVGGWHFTRVGECPPKVGLWEFYFFANLNAGGDRKGGGDVEKGWMGKGKGKEKKEGAERDAENGQKEEQGPRVPRWVTEKQSSDLGRLRLQDPKRSLRGISFGYPFVPRPVSAPRRTSASAPLAQPARWRQRVMWIITKPHGLFDCFYGVKLREVRGRPESGRRVFDPWIQRCSPVVHGMQSHSVGHAESKRLVLIVGDGLRADLLFNEDAFPTIPGSPKVVAPYLKSIAESRGAFGISHTRIPTESRPGHVALIGTRSASAELCFAYVLDHRWGVRRSFRTDKGKEISHSDAVLSPLTACRDGKLVQKIDVDSVFNQTSHTFAFGSPDVLSMFAHGETPGKVNLWCYSKEDIDYTKDAAYLDTWAFDRLKELFQNATSDATLYTQLRSDKVVFFLHLIGLDNTGHSYRPHSREYMNNIRLVDDIIHQTETVINEFYNDRDTSFIFTADHGMSVIGNHGDGDPDNTRTPLIAWGRGIRGPLPDSVPSSHDSYSKPWGLGHLFRRDVEQADLATLMASLLGIAWPINSVGVLPDVDPTQPGYLSSELGDELVAQMAFVNAKVILEQYTAKHGQWLSVVNIILVSYNSRLELKKAQALIYKPFIALEGSKANDDQSPRLAYLTNIERFIQAKDWRAARLASVELIRKSLDGLHYLQTYNKLLIRGIVAFAYTGWAAYTSLYIFCPLGVVKTRETSGTSFMHAMAAVTSIVFLAFLALQHVPLMFYLYITFPCYFWHQFFVQAMAGLRMPWINNWKSLIGAGMTLMAVQAMVVTFIVATMIITTCSVQSLQAKQGLPLTNQVLGWTVLGNDIQLGLSVGGSYHTVFSKFLVYFLGLGPSFIILSISVEGLFYTVYSLVLVTWVAVESILRTGRLPSIHNGSQKAKVYLFQLDDLRIAVFFLFFVQIGFFGAGNSFYLEPLFRLIATYSPFLAAALLIFKKVAPYIMLAVASILLNHSLQFPPFFLLLIALMLTDGMTITFFFNVHDRGTAVLPEYNVLI